MKKLILSAAVLSALSISVHAQTAAPTPEHTFTGNLTVGFGLPIPRHFADVQAAGGAGWV